MADLFENCTDPHKRACDALDDTGMTRGMTRGHGYRLTAGAKLPQHIQPNAEQTTEKQVKPGRVTCFDSKKTPPPTLFLQT